MLLYFAMTENTLRKSIPSFPLSASAALTSRPGAPRGGSYTPATRKAPKRRLRRMKRGGFEEVSRLPRRDSRREAADTTVSAEEYATRLARGAAAPRHAHGHQNVPPARFFSLRSCPFEPRPAVHSKKQDHPKGGLVFWSGRRGSNSLPRPWQGRALPDELRPHMAPVFQHHGASGRSRTNDTRIFSPLLYQLSYRGKWRPRWGSNPRPPA